MRTNYAVFNGSCLPKPSVTVAKTVPARSKPNSIEYTPHSHSHTHAQRECKHVGVCACVCVPGQVCLTALNKNNSNDELSAAK